MFNVCVTEAGLLQPYLWYCCKMVGMGTTKNILTTKKLKYMQNVKKGAESALLPSTCVCSTAKINLETAQTKNYSERKALPRAVLVRKSPKKLFGKYV